MAPTGKGTHSDPAPRSWYRRSGEKLTLSLYVQPGARRSEVAGLHDELLKVRIAAPAVDDRANTALIEFLSRAFDLPSSRIRIRAGQHARRKIVELDATGPAVEHRLTAWEQQ
ncbi:MAG TPA: DUF167 domain-containing protein [Burkholderiales bacterium]|nr:DUF167 domain-containing protein [Betaproteobacteria bacterium]HQR51893.1 DUF167 domain-containing protein [Burkholderiales bacterium]